MTHRVLIYWGMLTIGPILIGGSLSITSWLLGRSADLVHSPHELGFVFLKVVPFMLTILALSLLYLIVPNTSVPKFHAFLSGTIAGIAFELMKIWFGWYITHFTAYKLVYGAFASIPVFLLWIYLSWLIVLSGALLTASLPLWEQSSWRIRRFPGKRFYDALQILEALYNAQKSGTTLEVYTLHWQLRLGFDTVESILHDFSDHGFAKEAAEGGWLLARDADDITLSDIYRLTVFDPDLTAALPDELNRKIADIIDNGMKFPLKSAFRMD
jgi:membrane protein